MFVVSKRNIIIPSPDGSQQFRMAKGFMGEVPDWAGKTAYFKALAADGKIVASRSGKDKDIDAAGKPPEDPGDAGGKK